MTTWEPRSQGDLLAPEPRLLAAVGRGPSACNASSVAKLTALLGGAGVAWGCPPAPLQQPASQLTFQRGRDLGVSPGTQNGAARPAKHRSAEGSQQVPLTERQEGEGKRYGTRSGTIVRQTRRHAHRHTWDSWDRLRTDTETQV